MCGFILCLICYMKTADICLCTNTGLRIFITEKNGKNTQYFVKLLKILSILSIRYDKNDPSRVTINSPSIRSIYYNYNDIYI